MHCGIIALEFMVGRWFATLLDNVYMMQVWHLQRVHIGHLPLYHSVCTPTRFSRSEGAHRIANTDSKAFQLFSFVEIFWTWALTSHSNPFLIF